MLPTPDRFRRLARSAPYRWRSLLLEGTWGPHTDRLRFRVQQPDRLRVERLDGTLLLDDRQGSLGSSALLTSDGRHVPGEPEPPVPELDADGLVVTERRPWDDGPDLPMWQDYRFVAVLDPYELSTGVDVRAVHEVDHHGRPAWEALLRPTDEYEPRCACCPLMLTRECDLAERLPVRPGYAEAHRVRLDVATGVCVQTVEVGGPTAGAGHALRIREAAGDDGPT